MCYHVMGCDPLSKESRFAVMEIKGCIQKFPDWPPGARTANGTALCHSVQLYRYIVSQSSEFYRHNNLCCFSTGVYCCLFRYRLSPETFGYTLVLMRRKRPESFIRKSRRGLSFSPATTATH
jgi:hypothetical protein